MKPILIKQNNPESNQFDLILLDSSSSVDHFYVRKSRRQKLIIQYHHAQIKDKSAKISFYASTLFYLKFFYIKT